MMIFHLDGSIARERNVRNFRQPTFCRAIIIRHRARRLSLAEKSAN